MSLLCFWTDASQVYQAPDADPNAQVVIHKDSSRLQLLDAFPQWSDKEMQNMHVLIKVAGKCTTDHISAAGPWLKYKVSNEAVPIVMF